MNDRDKILHSDTVMNNAGTEYTLEVQNDWMAGHGLFVDENDVPNRFRWSVYLESPGRPRYAYRYGVGSLELAIQQGTEKLREFRDR